MTAQVYSVSSQTEGRRNPYLEWKSIDLSYKLPHKCGVMLTIINVFIILFLFVGIGNIFSIFKISQ